MDLIRDLLLGIEADSRFSGRNWISPDEKDNLGVLGVSDHSHEEVAYHLALLIEGQYLIGKTTMEMPIISRLTWEGHEFLDNIRDPGIWGKTKERLKGLPNIALSVIAQIAQAEIKKHVGLT